jgi:hypothetical protein
MSLTAVIPVWNGRSLLERLLTSLEAQTRRPDQIIVVDNGSTDGAPDLARARGARIVRMGFNAGFAAAVNVGIKEARTEWIAALNSDVELAPDYLERLSGTGALFATGKILSPDGSIDAAFDLLCRGGAAWRAGSGRADAAPFQTRRAISSAPWTAALFRRDLFDRTGLLEESFESYLEDADFGLRCAALGIEGVYEPAAVAWHQGSATLGRWSAPMVRLIARNQVLLVARRYPGALLWRWFWPLLVAQSLWGLLAVRHGAGLAWLRGKYEGLRAFRAARELPGAADKRVLEDVLPRQEQLIRELQSASGYDLYWRMYFFLTGGGA